MLPSPFRKVTLETAGEQEGQPGELMPEPHALVQPQEVTGASGNRVRQGEEARLRMWHSGKQAGF